MPRTRGAAAVAVAALFAAVAAPLPGRGQSSSLLDESSAGAIRRELSGVEAKRNIVGLTQWDRIPASPGFYQAAAWLRDRLHEHGIDTVDVERYVGGDPHPFRKGSAAQLPNWTVRRAELRVVEPFDRLVTSYEQTPISVARYSRPVSVRADLVDIGRGMAPEEYEGRDVAGKLVLATGDSGTVESLAVGRFGAAGVVVSGGASYGPHMGWGYPAMVTWQVLNPHSVDGREPTFVFSISAAEGERLRRELRSGRVVLSAEIDADLSPGVEEIVTALIPGAGSADQEVLLLSHLDHVRPSANDNASGSGLLLEIARTLRLLIDQGVIPPPRRSIRFLWMTEGAGTYGYVNAHPEVRDRVIAATNLDMVGEWPLPGMGPLTIRRPPDSRPVYLLDVFTNLARWLDRVPLRTPTGSDSLMNMRVKPWSPDSDHYILNDAALGIPTVFLEFGPDPFHHTNLDAPDKVDPTTLKRVGVLTAAAVYLVATAGEEDAYRIADEVFAEGVGRLAEATREGLATVGSVEVRRALEAYWLAERRLFYRGRREQEAIRSVKILAPEVASHLDALARALESQRNVLAPVLAAAYRARTGTLPGERPLDRWEREAARIVPSRVGRLLNERWRDELDPSRLEPGDLEWIGALQARLTYSYIRIPELLNFMDGERSLLDIRDALSAEEFDFGQDQDGVGTTEDISLETRLISMADVRRLVGIMARSGMVTLEEHR